MWDVKLGVAMALHDMITLLHYDPQGLEVEDGYHDTNYHQHIRNLTYLDTNYHQHIRNLTLTQEVIDDFDSGYEGY